MIVGDMPFLSYKINIQEAVRNAGRFIQEGGAEAVKVEGGTKICPTIEAIIDADIQVMGHIGLTPQAVYEFGGFLVQGKTIETAKNLILDAKNLEKSGVFSIVLESIPWQIAKLITKSIDIPTIGIGAGSYCDGQILVINDMLGLFNYKNEVEKGLYPDREHSYEFPQETLEQINDWFENVDIEEEFNNRKV